jgi:hypothetical protein
MYSRLGWYCLFPFPCLSLWTRGAPPVRRIRGWISCQRQRQITSPRELNEDLEEFCSSSPNLSPVSSGSGHSIKRLYGLGLLPLVPEASPSDVLKTITQISSLPHLKGLIMGTRGLGRGLDDEELEPVWGEIERNGLVVFLHPHYGVPSSMWGERDNGHVLPLALGFPFETTIVRFSPFQFDLNY